MTRNRPRPPERPKAIVLAAYVEASRGRYSVIHGLTDPALRQHLVDVHAKLAAAYNDVRRRLLKIKGRRDAAAVRARRALRRLAQTYRPFVKLNLGSRKFERAVWKGVTRGPCLVRVEATREIVRGRNATVYLRLTLRDGTVIRETESLVLRRGRWYF